MIASLRSELVKLFRRNAVFGYAGAAVAFTALMTVVSITNAGDPQASGPGSSASLTPEQLAEPGGFLAGLEAANNFLGIIALALFASSIAAEFSTGTIRALLVTDSRRRTLLAGKVVGLTAFLVATLTVAAFVGAIVAGVLGGRQGIDTDAWLTLSGLTEGITIWASVSIAVIGWGMFGALLAMISRSAAISIAAGVAYFLIAEHLILRSLWPAAADWLPSGLLSALAEGGTPTVSFTTALTLSALYAAAAYGVTLLIFERRDITD
jgi:ABC-2 type transport system permease protein